MSKVIKVKVDEMKRLAKLYRLNASGMANKIGVNRETYLRAMEGGNVSARFVAGTSLGFGIDFNAIFYAAEKEKKEAAAA